MQFCLNAAQSPCLAATAEASVERGTKDVTVYPKQPPQITTSSNQVSTIIHEAAKSYRAKDYKTASQILSKIPETLKQNSEGSPRDSWTKSRLIPVIEFLADSLFLAGEYNQAAPLYGQALDNWASDNAAKFSPTFNTSLPSADESLRSFNSIAESELRLFKAGSPNSLPQQKHYHSRLIETAAQDLNVLAMIYGLQKRFADADKLSKAALPYLGNRVSNNFIGGETVQRPDHLPEMEAIAEQVLSITERSLGQNDLMVATRLDILAQYYIGTKNQREAAVELTRAIAIKQKRFGKDAAEIADDVEKLRDILILLQNTEAAEIWSQRLLAIKEKISGPDNLNLLPILQNCAYCAYSRQAYADAIQFEQRMLTIQEKHLGKNDPALIDTLHRMADYNQAQGNLAQAEALWQQIVEIAKTDTKTYQQYLPNYLYSLSCVMEQEGKIDQEQLVLQTELQTLEKRNAAPGVLESEALNKLALVAKIKGNLAECESLLKKSLSICERRAEGSDRQTKMTLVLLSDQLKEQHKYTELEPILKNSVSSSENIPRMDVSFLLWSLSQLVDCYAEQAKFDAAEEAAMKALTIAQRFYGNNPNQTCPYIDSLASILVRENKTAEAEKFYKQALAMFESENQPAALATRLSKLANFYRSVGKTKEADDIEARRAAILKSKSSSQSSPHR